MSGKGCSVMEPCVTQGLSEAVVIQERVQRWLGVDGSQMSHKALSFCILIRHKDFLLNIIKGLWMGFGEWIRDELSDQKVHSVDYCVSKVRRWIYKGLNSAS